MLAAMKPVKPITCPHEGCRKTYIPRVAKPLRCARCQKKLVYRGAGRMAAAERRLAGWEPQ